MASESALATLDHIWGVLQPLGHPLALMGGISLAAWNHVRATRDVDLLIAIDRTEIEQVLATLASHQCRPKKTPPLTSVGEHCFLQMLYTPPGEFYDVQFDLLLAESQLQKSALERTVQRIVPGVSQPIEVLHCDDLVLFKLLAGRMIDRADAAMLLRENREAIDFDYLMSWVTRLNLNAEFNESWGEAYPDEDLPTSPSG